MYSLFFRLIFITFLTLFLSPPFAWASFRVCNQTDNMIGVAIGYRTDKNWVSKGWWKILPKQCDNLINTTLHNRFYYLYVEDQIHHKKWQGPVPMCISNKQFTITNVQDCFIQGYGRAGFEEYDTGNQSNWTVEISDNGT